MITPDGEVGKFIYLKVEQGQGEPAMVASYSVYFYNNHQETERGYSVRLFISPPQENLFNY